MKSVLFGRNNVMVTLVTLVLILMPMLVLAVVLEQQRHNRRIPKDNVSYSNDMKLVFFGDSMFGRDNHSFIEDPFIHVKGMIRSGTHIFFNLETTISNPPLSHTHKDDKVFNYQSTGEQLVALRKITKKPIFVSVVNNHSLDYGPEGHRNTVRFLKKHQFLTNSKKRVESDGIVFLNATDHCGCKNPDVWSEHILMIDYDNLEPILQRVRNLKDKFIVFSIHWGSNYVKGDMPKRIQEFGKALIDHGVNIVFGHSAHHIVREPIRMYNGGIIIYGLGDFINDYMVDPDYKSDQALLCTVTVRRKKMTYEATRVKKRVHRFLSQCSLVMTN